MKIQRVAVNAGRTFNHPHEQYSNMKPGVTIEAFLEEGEDAGEIIKKLQAQAKGLVEDHKQNMLRSLEELHQLGQREEEVQGLRRQLLNAQIRLDEIRKEHPALLTAPLKPETPSDEVIF